MTRVAAGTRVAATRTLAVAISSPRAPGAGLADKQGLPDTNFADVNITLANVYVSDLMPNSLADTPTGVQAQVGTVGAGGTMAVGEFWATQRGNFPCSALSQAIPAGAYLVFSNGAGNDDMVQCTSGAAQGATSVPLVNFVAAIVRTPASTGISLYTGTKLIDYCIAKAQARPNGQVKIRLFYGETIPGWLAAYTDTANIPSPFTIADSGGNTSAQCATWWTGTFQAAVHAVESKLAALYDGIAVVRDITVGAMMTTYVEPMVRQVRDTGQPNNIMASNVATLGLAGFTVAKDSAAYTAYFADAFATFPTVERSLAVNNYGLVSFFDGPHVISANTATTITTSDAPNWPTPDGIAIGSSCVFVARCWGAATNDPGGGSILQDSRAKFQTGASPVAVGDQVWINATAYAVASIQSDTQLTITGAFNAPGSGGTNGRSNGSVAMLGFTYFVLVGTSAGDFGASNTGSWKIIHNTANSVTIPSVGGPVANDLIGAFMFVMTADGLDTVTMQTIADRHGSAGAGRAVYGNHNGDATTSWAATDTPTSPTLRGYLHRKRQQGFPFYVQIASDTAVNGNLAAHPTQPITDLTLALDGASQIQPNYVELQGYWMRDFGTSSAGGAGSATMTDGTKLWGTNIWGRGAASGANAILKFDVSGNIYYVQTNTNTVLTLADAATLAAADAAPAAYHLFKWSGTVNGNAGLSAYRASFAGNPTSKSRVAAGARVPA